MADTQGMTETLTAFAGTTATWTTAVSTTGMRDLVFSIELSAAASTGSDTLTVTIQHSNADSSLHSTSNDNYFQTFYAFAAIAGNVTVPYISHADMTQTLVNAVTLNIPRSIGKWIRYKYIVVNASGNAAYTGKIRTSWNNAVTS